MTGQDDRQRTNGKDPSRRGDGEQADEQRVARAALCRLAEPGDQHLAALVERIGVVQVVRQIQNASLPSERLPHYRSRVSGLDPERDLAGVHRVGGRFVCPGDLEWPTQLDDLGPRRPWGLWVRGAENLRLACLRSVAVVGARAATAYGAHIAGDIGAGLADQGWAVVSGAAFGIDAAAHLGALSVGGLTVAVLACGVDQAYPRSHETLIARVAEQGLLVSELPLGAHPTKPRFLVRNRLIAALTRGTAVVEAAARSGARNTAREAGEIGRHVMAVPGPVTSALSVGTHDLIRSQAAVLVTGPRDILDLLSPVGENLSPEVRGSARPHDHLDPMALRVLEALPVRRPATTARVGREAGLDQDTVLTLLGRLDLLGLAERVDAGWRLVQGGDSAEREAVTAAVPPPGRLRENDRDGCA